MVYKIETFWSDSDDEFITQSLDYPGITAFGKTITESLHEFGIALELAVETLEEDAHAEMEKTASVWK